MPLFEITESGIERHAPTGFSRLGLRERDDLQRLLRDRIDILGEGLLVVAEEFGDWEDARRRVDLLALDRDGHLVVIELKRTESGGHMDLQALRYAAMVSAMTFDDVVAAYERFSARARPDAEVEPRASSWIVRSMSRILLAAVRPVSEQVDRERVDLLLRLDAGPHRHPDVGEHPADEAAGEGASLHPHLGLGPVEGEVAAFVGDHLAKQRVQDRVMRAANQGVVAGEGGSVR